MLYHEKKNQTNKQKTKKKKASKKLTNNERSDFLPTRDISEYRSTGLLLKQLKIIPAKREGYLGKEKSEKGKKHFITDWNLCLSFVVT